MKFYFFGGALETPYYGVQGKVGNCGGVCGKVLCSVTLWPCGVMFEAVCGCIVNFYVRLSVGKLISEGNKCLTGQLMMSICGCFTECHWVADQWKDGLWSTTEYGE